MSSPRTWGCFFGDYVLDTALTVFPTHVGVFLAVRSAKVSHFGLPHARGGVSQAPATYNDALASSPRTWGCFSWTTCPTAAAGVFPTHVGVFPLRYAPLA